MTLIDWNPASGALRCDQLGLDLILKENPVGETVADERARAALADTSLHHFVAPMLDFATAALCIAARPEDLLTYQIWYGRESGRSLLNSVDSEFARMVAVHPSSLPVILARAIQLRPRQMVPRNARRLPFRSTNELFQEDVVLRRGALSQLEASSASYVEVIGEERVSTLTIIDGSDGFYQVIDSEEGALMEPVTATTIFQQLARHFQP